MNLDAMFGGVVRKRRGSGKKVIRLFGVNISPEPLSSNTNTILDNEKTFLKKMTVATPLSRTDFEGVEINANSSPFDFLCLAGDVARNYYDLDHQVKIGREEMDTNPKKKRKMGMMIKNPLPPTPTETTEMPLKLKKLIQEMDGSEVKLVIQKLLFKTDVNPNHNRLLIPVGKINSKFLTEEEEKIWSNSRGGGQGIPEIHAMLIESSFDEVCEVIFKKWETLRSYVLIKNWNSIALRNGLREGQLIQLWSFRKDHKLCFALVKLHDNNDINGASCSGVSCSSEITCI